MAAATTTSRKQCAHQQREHRHEPAALVRPGAVLAGRHPVHASARHAGMPPPAMTASDASEMKCSTTVRSAAADPLHQGIAEHSSIAQCDRPRQQDAPPRRNPARRVEPATGSRQARRPIDHPVNRQPGQHDEVPGTSRSPTRRRTASLQPARRTSAPSARRCRRTSVTMCVVCRPSSTQTIEP